jgi:hypothetical protein
MASSSLWQRFQQYFVRYDDVDFSIDISRMKFADDFFDQMRPKVDKAFGAMRELRQMRNFAATSKKRTSASKRSPLTFTPERLSPRTERNSPIYY